MLYPRKGVSDLARMTPKAVEEKYFATPARYPELAALVGESSDNLPGVPGVGPKTAAKWLEMYDGLENLAAHAGELKGKAAEAFQERVNDVLRNRQINALVLDLDLPVSLDDLERRPWNREATHQLFDGLEFRVLRDRLLEALPNEDEVVPEGGFDLEAARLEPGELAGWLAEHAAGERTGVDVIGHWGPGPATSGPRRWPRPTAQRRTSTVSELGTGGRECARGLAGRPEPQGDARRQRSAAGDLGSRLGPRGLTSDTQLAAYLTRPDQRTFDLADLTIRYLKRELKVEGAPELDDPDQLALDFGDDDSGAKVAADASMVRARAVIDLADALDAEIEQRNGTSLLYGVELPLLRTLARMEQTGVAVDVDHLETLESEFAATVNQRRERRVRGARQADQPRLAEAAPGGAVRRARDAQDPAHPHRLHHRRGRAPAAVRQDRTPVPGPPAGAPGRDPAQADRRGSAQVGGRRRPDPHDVRADDRRHRPAVQHRPQPAEHPDPHRGGAPDPRRRSSSGEGYDAADVGRLLPDRDAHHGARQRGREPDRGVQVGHGLPHRHRVPGLRRRAEPGDAGRAGQDQGDELRPGLWAERVRAEPAAEHRGRPRQGADG